MNIFQVMCFIALAHAPTFHEAAEKMYVSQSSFSNNIQTIERELGVVLVERCARGFSLTEAGRTFLAYAEDIVGEYGRMTGILSEYRAGSKNRIMLYVDNLTSFAYNETLTAFRGSAPEIQTEITEIGGMDVLETLGSCNNAACVVFSSGEDALDGTRRCTLLRDNLAVLVNRKCPLSERSVISLRELDGSAVKVVLAKPQTFLYDYTVRQFQKAGVTPDIGPYTLWYSTIVDVIRELDHIAVLPSKVAGIFCPPDMRAIDIADADPYSVDLVISEQCTHSAVLRFFEFAENAEKSI